MILCVKLWGNDNDNQPYPQCLKILEKVSFKIASEASYVYIFSEQKFIKNAKMVNWWEMPKLKDSDETFFGGFLTMCLAVTTIW